MISISIRLLLFFRCISSFSALHGNGGTGSHFHHVQNGRRLRGGYNREMGRQLQGAQCTPVGTAPLYEFQGTLLVNLQGNGADLNDLEIAKFETSFVQTYNFAVGACEQSNAFRFLEEATLLPADDQEMVVGTNNDTALMEIVGFCNACGDGIVDIFESEISTVINPLTPFMMSDEDNATTTCVCDGPVRDSFINDFSNVLGLVQLNFGVDDISQAELIGVLDPETNNITNFESDVVMRLPISILQATTEQIEQLEEAFLIGYNRANNQDQYCDPLFRTVTNVEVDFGISGLVAPGGRVLQQDATTQFPETSSATSSPTLDPLSPTLASPTLSPTTVFDVDHGTQTNSTSTPSGTEVPTSQPTIAFFVDLIDVRLLVQGTCVGCPSNQNLFDQVLDSEGGRRNRRVENEEEDHMRRPGKNSSLSRILQQKHLPPRTLESPQGGVVPVFQVVEDPTCPEGSNDAEGGEVQIRGPTLEEFIEIFVAVEVDGTIPAQELGAVCIIDDGTMSDGSCVPGFENVLEDNTMTLVAGESYTSPRTAPGAAPVAAPGADPTSPPFSAPSSNPAQFPSNLPPEPPSESTEESEETDDSTEDSEEGDESNTGVSEEDNTDFTGNAPTPIPTTGIAPGSQQNPEPSSPQTTPAPTSPPTLAPTHAETSPPSLAPTPSPTTLEPTHSPTQLPTMPPTSSPTTPEPTASPTQPPTISPTPGPTTPEPTASPTLPPTISPTPGPTPTPEPTPEPTPGLQLGAGCVQAGTTQQLMKCFDISQPTQLVAMDFDLDPAVPLPDSMTIRAYNVLNGDVQQGPGSPNGTPPIFAESISSYSLGGNTHTLSSPLSVNSPGFCVGVQVFTSSSQFFTIDSDPGSGDSSWIIATQCGYLPFISLEDLGQNFDFNIDAILSQP